MGKAARYIVEGGGVEGNIDVRAGGISEDVGSSALVFGRDVSEETLFRMNATWKGKLDGNDLCAPRPP